MKNHKNTKLVFISSIYGKKKHWLIRHVRLEAKLNKLMNSRKSFYLLLCASCVQVFQFYPKNFHFRFLHRLEFLVILGEAMPFLQRFSFNWNFFCYYYWWSFHQWQFTNVKRYVRKLLYVFDCSIYANHFSKFQFENQPLKWFVPKLWSHFNSCIRFHANSRLISSIYGNARFHSFSVYSLFIVIWFAINKYKVVALLLFNI